MGTEAIGELVRHYNLFGEEGDLPDVVHCETIEARSVLHDWEFAPHRHARLHQVFLIESGGGTATLDSRRIVLTDRTLLNVPCRIVHGFSFQRGTSGYVLSVASEALDQILENSRSLRQVLSEPARLSADRSMEELLRTIFAEYDERQFARAQMLRSLCGVLFGQVARGLSRQPDGWQADRRNPVLSRFEALLELHFSDRWTAADYADALAVTATHLTRIVRAATGKPVSRLIEDRTIQEARRYLVYTNLPVSKIAYSLGFSDPAYFSRVFRRATRHSPGQFRQLTMQAKIAPVGDAGEPADPASLS